VAFRGSLRAARHLGDRLRRGCGLGRRHQRLEDPLVVAFFRVPLHADTELVPLQLDRFHDLILGPRHGEETGADAVDGLVVGGGHQRGRTEHGPELAGCAYLHLVSGHLHRIRLVALVADPVGEMLGEGAAAGDVEDVHAAADGEEGKVGVDRRAGHEELEPVPPVVRRVRLLVRSLLVEQGVDISASGQHQAVNPGDEAGHGTGGDGRQHDRRSASALDDSRIAHRRHDGFANPVAPASSLKLAGDADDRAPHPSSS
jgi:hypothetical protein